MHINECPECGGRGYRGNAPHTCAGCGGTAEAVAQAAEKLCGGGSPFFRPGQEDVLTKRRAITGAEVHYFIGPIRETLEEAEDDRKRWTDAPDLLRERDDLLTERAVALQTEGYLNQCIRHVERQRDALADALEAAWLRDYSLDIACETCGGRPPTCDAGPTGPIPHEPGCLRGRIEVALRLAGRLPTTTKGDPE